MPVLGFGGHELIGIDLYEVPPGGDDAFVAAWKAEGAGTLYRALRADAAFRYVAVDRDAGTGYEVLLEDGDPDGAAGAILVAPFDVAPGDDDAFVATWRRTREVIAAQRGFIGGRLCRASGDAAFRFVEITAWSSPLMLQRATRATGVEPPPLASLYLTEDVSSSAAARGGGD